MTWKRRTNDTRQNLHQQVVDELGIQLIRGDFPPGHVFPNEAELGTKLGISRTAMREAIKVLAAKGLVESRQKLGTIVRPRSQWNMLDPDVLSWWGAVGPLEEFSRTVYELRRMVEPEAAAMAAVRATDREIERIAVAYDAMATLIEDAAATVEPDLAFHMAILTAAGNELVRSLGALIETALIANLSITSAVPQAIRNSLPLHRAVLDEIRAHRPDGARNAMIALLDDATALIRSVCAKNEEQTRPSMNMSQVAGSVTRALGA